MDSVHVSRFVIAGVPSAVAPARRRCVATLRDWGVPLNQDAEDAIELVSSELLGNAIRHADGSVLVALYAMVGRCLIEVYDNNPDPPIERSAAEDDESGRGLALVKFVATKHGWQPTEGGKKCWAELELPAGQPSAPNTKEHFLELPGHEGGEEVAHRSRSAARQRGTY
jgi:anti-sigma regulatory factor (Ser/Thr protein kinase)